MSVYDDFNTEVASITEDDDVFFSMSFDDMPDNRPVPEGKYKLRCKSVKKGKTQGGANKLSWQWEVFENTDESLNGRVIEDTISFGSQGAKQMAHRVLQQLGLVSEGRIARFNPEDVVGKVFGAVIKNEVSAFTFGEERSRPRRYFDAALVDASDD